ncbi:MAG: hypothetical protein M3345_05225 [Actinomycetota bacterium]|nr:hypothetical protein [Actinomycetota bacterium]
MKGPRGPIVVVLSALLLLLAARSVLGGSGESSGPGPSFVLLLFAIMGIIASGRAGALGPTGAKIVNGLFYAFFAVYSLGALVWLVMGLTPALTAALPTLHENLHDVARSGGSASGLARNVASASHGSEPLGLVVFGYLFSALNLGLAFFLIRRRSGDRTARLLAIGMVGTAATFNLQAHTSLVVIPALKGVTHDVFHVVTGMAYVFALLLFPTGDFVPRWSHLQWWKWPIRIAYLLALTMAGFVIAANFHGDNAVGWVAFFGFLIPIAGVTSQVSRYRHASSREERQQSRILMWALSLAFAAALVMVGVMVGFTSGSDSQTTKSYEFAAPRAGTYYFQCDPHADEMKGVLKVVDGGGPAVAKLAAEDGTFTASDLEVGADRDVTIRFTNMDNDGHNVSVYRSVAGRDPVFIGQVFSGQDLSGFVFFVFPALFAAIPITLFIVLVRYRLWDIDHVINRALVYAVLTGILAAIYLGIVIGLGDLVRGITGNQENRVVVAISTLAVAALFRPIRHQIQGFIDRRFYRRKYDAAKTLDGFTARLRDQIDLDTLTAELLSVVELTMQPCQVSLWLRGTDGAEGTDQLASVQLEGHLVRSGPA